MYYNAYQPDKNASGLLHNLGLIFFSLQAIVSNGMAMFKPDIKKSIYDLYDASLGRVVEKYCCSCSSSSSSKQRGREDGVVNGAGAGTGAVEAAIIAKQPLPMEVEGGDVEAPLPTEPQSGKEGDPISTLTTTTSSNIHSEMTPITESLVEIEIEIEEGKNETENKNGTAEAAIKS